MKRFILSYLTDWLTSLDRKPLVIRGARQVGKTWIVRHLAEISGKQLIELNLEKEPQNISLFSSNKPSEILLNLSAALDKEIDPQSAILFFDEIQIAPELLGKLRWFAEEMPELPVIAAGSLLDFALAKHAFSMPVGRISYIYLEPLSFEEFIVAKGNNSLYEYLLQYQLNTKIPEAIHKQLLQLFKEYLVIGGMPAVVSNWINTHSLQKINQIQNDLLSTYRDDFSKYNGRITQSRLNEVMMSVPKFLGEKFVFSRVDKEIKAATLKQILNLLEQARICYKVKCTAANGVPLEAEVKSKYFKEIFLDVGLCSAMLGLDLTYINAADEITLINNGGIAEQVVGQLLRAVNKVYLEPALYCWSREEKNSNAEIDYIIQYGNQVVPVEVKAGSSGALKSLHMFMGLKNLVTAIRINTDYPSKMTVDVKDTSGKPVKYKLVSLPFYLIGQIHRILDENKDS